MAMVRGASLGFVLLFATFASAQAIDPKLLQSLQGQLGASQAIRQSAPAESDTTEQSGAGNNISAIGGKIDTLEEQQVRRAQARVELSKLYQASPIERDYRQRLQDRELRQFGYDFFQAAPAPTGVRTGAIGDDYVLGIGDELQISFRGATNSSQTVRVERDGRIAVGPLRPIQAAGRTVGGVRAELAAETRRTLLATDV